MPLAGALFPLAALLALLGLAYVALDAVPPTLGTVALVLTIAALGLAILH